VSCPVGGAIENPGVTRYCYTAIKQRTDVTYVTIKIFARGVAKEHETEIFEITTLIEEPGEQVAYVYLLTNPFLKGVEPCL